MLPRSVIPVCCLVLLLAACSQSETSTAVTRTTAEIVSVECEVIDGEDRPATDSVAMSTGEWFIDVPGGEVPVGTVEVTAVNVGDTNHEIVFVRAQPGADDPLDLPEAGAYVDEAALAPGTFVGALQGLGPQESCAGTFVFDPGTYVAFCNLSAADDQGRASSHYALGTVASFTVG